MLGRKHSGKVSKKFIGNFYFWGITLISGDFSWQSWPTMCPHIHLKFVAFVIFQIFIFVVFSCTGKNNGFPILDVLGYLQKTHKNPQIWESETNPNQGIPNQVPKLGFVSLSQIWDFCGYPLNTLKYPKLGIRYFFLWGCCVWDFRPALLLFLEYLV